MLDWQVERLIAQLPHSLEVGTAQDGPYGPSQLRHSLPSPANVKIHKTSRKHKNLTHVIEMNMLQS